MIFIDNETTNEGTKYQQILEKYGPPPVIINTNENYGIDKLFNIKSVPSIIFLRDREPIKTLVSPTESQIKETIKETYGDTE